MSLKSYHVHHVQNNEQLEAFIDSLDTPGCLALQELTIDLSLKFENKTLDLQRTNLIAYLQHLQTQMPLFVNLQAFTMFVELPVPYPANQNYFDFDLFNEIVKDLDSREDWRGDATDVIVQGAVHGIYSFWSKDDHNVSPPAILGQHHNDLVVHRRTIPVTSRMRRGEQGIVRRHRNHNTRMSISERREHRICKDRHELWREGSHPRIQHTIAGESTIRSPRGHAKLKKDILRDGYALSLDRGRILLDILDRSICLIVTSQSSPVGA